MKLTRFFAAAACFAAPALIACAALAQAVSPAAPDTTVGLGGIFGWLRPYLLDLAGVFITAFIGVLGKKFYDWTGLNIEQRHRDSLHSAVMTGVASWLDYYGKRADGLSIDVRNKVIADAANYAIAHAPDAIKALGVSRETLVELASSKLSILREAPGAIPVGKPPAVTPG